jgi:hypothetical protein
MPSLREQLPGFMAVAVIIATTLVLLWVFGAWT